MAVKPISTKEAAAMMQAEDSDSNSATLGKLLANTEVKQISFIRVTEKKNGNPEWQQVTANVLCVAKKIYLGDSLTGFEINKLTRKHLAELSGLDRSWQQKIYNIVCNESQWQANLIVPSVSRLCENDLQGQACVYQEINICESDVLGQLGIS
jgi:hypothetical protein